jgi:hypothetical protein
MAMFDARAAAEAHAEAHGEELFEFKGMDGKTYFLPPFSTLTTGQAKRLQAGDFDTLAEVADEEACAAIDDMPIAVLEDLGESWSEGASDTGKSGSASPRTSNGGKPRRRTSRSGASTSNGSTSTRRGPASGASSRTRRR